MRLSGFLLILLVGACASPPSATMDKRALAERLAALQYTPETMRVMARAYVDEYLVRLPDYSAACPESGEFVGQCNAMADEIESDIRSTFERSIVWTDQLYPRMVDNQIEILVDFYTIEELAASLAFSESPEGRSILAKMPAADARATAASYDLLRPWTELLGSQIDQIHDNYAVEFKALLDE